MKKNSAAEKGPRRRSKASPTPRTIGMDIGDKESHYCVLSEAGEVVEEKRCATTRAGIARAFAQGKRCRIALEVGTHSPWLSRQLKGYGYEVIVANPRQLALISQSSRKNDRTDARQLARLARVDPALLRPIRHRGEQAQNDLLVIRARAALVETRTALVNRVRGMVKGLGERLKKCDTDNVNRDLLEALPEGPRKVLEPLAEQIESLSEKIHAYDDEIAAVARERYPETALLKQVSGVGELIALTFVLTLEDPARFKKSRDVGCYVGLRPKRSQSGSSDPQLGISKEGDVYLRKLLVQGAHHILSKRGPDTDLQRWGRKLAGTGNKAAKKKAVVAVARKLAVLLHCLWVNGEVYEPLRNSEALQKAA
jgi:transposase